MGRHGSGKSNYKVAAWVWVALIALVAIVVLVIGWTVVKDRNTEQIANPECAGESYQLTVWADPSAQQIASDLAEDFNATNPSSLDRCIEAAVAPMADAEAAGQYAAWADNVEAPQQPAAVWIPAAVTEAIEQLGDAPIQFRQADAPQLAGGAVVVAPELTGEPAAAVHDELRQRAADQFVNFAANSEGAEGSVAVSTAPSVSNVPSEETAESLDAPDAQHDESAQQTRQAQQVTFVLDTSGSMGLVEGGATRLDNVREPLAKTMMDVGAAGGTVGLWNYSSPLSAQATTPYRNNVDITVGDDGATSVAILRQLGFGGATHTYSSITAAYASAAAGAHGDDPSRVVLVTDGPNDGGAFTLEQAVAQIKMLHGKTPVQLEVVAIGDRVDVEALRQLAQAAGGSVHQVGDSLGVEQALTAAVD